MENGVYISVIIPAYNSEQTIERTIESILDQNFSSDKYEIIVVDNGSKDRTVNIVKKYPVRIVTYEEKGSYKARNKGACYARGEILAFTDSDCVADENWLNEIEEEFKDSNLHAVQGQGSLTQMKDSKVKMECFVGEYFSEIIRSMGEKKRLGDTKNFAIRKWVFKKVGGFIPFKTTCDILFVEELLRRNYNVKFNKRMIVYHNYSLSMRRIIRRSIRYGLGDFLLTKSNKKSRLNGLHCVFSYYRLVTYIIFLQDNTLLRRLQLCLYFWSTCLLRVISYSMGSYFISSTSYLTVCQQPIEESSA